MAKRQILVREEREEVAVPRRCWLHDRWCSPGCMAYRNGECATLSLLESLHDRLGELESILADLTDALRKEG